MLEIGLPTASRFGRPWLFGRRHHSARSHCSLRRCWRRRVGGCPAAAQQAPAPGAGLQRFLAHAQEIAPVSGAVSGEGKKGTWSWKQNALKKLSESRTSSSEAVSVISILRSSNQLSCREYTIMISFTSRASLWQSSLALFADMQAVEVTPDSTAFATAINGCRKTKRWQHALGLFQDMKKQEVAPSLSTLNALISVCGEAGRWRDVLTAFSEVLNYTVRPNLVSFNSLLDAAATGAQWQLALELMRGAREASHFNIAMKTCAASRCWKQCLQILKEIAEASAFRRRRHS
ncbi:unnamed protein product, partial [Effrenium voratum]